MGATAHPRGVAEMIPIEHETSDRVVRTMVFVVPPAALVVAGWLAWGGALHWQDLLVLAITYTLTGLGITVGYHRLFTHRSFKTTRPVRVLLAVLGSMLSDRGRRRSMHENGPRVRAVSVAVTG